MLLTLFDKTYEVGQGDRLEIVNGAPGLTDAWVGPAQGTPKPVQVEVRATQTSPLPYSCAEAGKLAVCTVYDCSGKPGDGWKACRIANHWGD